jgi:hypothetical protein
MKKQTEGAGSFPVSHNQLVQGMDSLFMLPTTASTIGFREPRDNSLIAFAESLGEKGPVLLSARCQDQTVFTEGCRCVGGFREPMQTR